MPGSLTVGRAVRALALAPPTVSPSADLNASAPGMPLLSRLNGWPVGSPCRRFAVTFAGANARLGAE